MKTKLLLLIALFFSAININAQVTSVALVGEAAGGWPGQPGNPGPTDVHQMTSTDGVNWTLNAITLTTFASGGGVKFRANNAWDINWGDAAFPSGTGTQGGANILCIAGTYDVTFNSTTGVYNFSGGTPLPVVKLVGTAVTTSGGLVMNVSGPDTFTISNVTLVAGNAQFDVDGDLFGGTTFPTGSALSNTSLIPIPAAFFSSITINLATGEYSFVLIPPVSIVGDAVGGWPGSAGNPGPIDTNQLSSNDAINYKLDKLACVVGPAKFRQDNAWTTNWGNVAFPTGTATQGGDNIAITTASTYDVKFNRVTGEYSFSIPTFALVGAATSTGWPTGTPGEIDANALTTTDGVTYTLANVALSVGPCKFRANNAWDVNFGDAAFPSGTATQGGANIEVTTANNYDVSLNRVTGAYNFTPSLSVNQFGIDAVSVYPNPTASNFSINGNFEKVQVYTISGQLIKTFVSSDNNQFSISDLSTGLYLVRVSDANNNNKTLKLIKE
jgi:hypothetical protein